MNYSGVFQPLPDVAVVSLSPSTWDLSTLTLDDLCVTGKSSISQKYKVPKFSDVRKLCCNLPKIQEKRPNLWVFLKKMKLE